MFIARRKRLAIILQLLKPEADQNGHALAYPNFD